MILTRVPVRQWIHREFEGVDPWAANRPVRWSIVTFRMVPKSMLAVAACDAQTVPSETNDIPKKYAIGICQGVKGRYRILPKALAAAWRGGQVQDPDLARLLYESEAALRSQDDQPGPLTGRGRVHAILLGAIALGIFGCYLLTLWLSLRQMISHP